jgi:hypothetical protein
MLVSNTNQNAAIRQAADRRFLKSVAGHQLIQVELKLITREKIGKVRKNQHKGKRDRAVHEYDTDTRFNTLTMKF